MLQSARSAAFQKFDGVRFDEFTKQLLFNFAVRRLLDQAAAGESIYINCIEVPRTRVRVENLAVGREIVIENLKFLLGPTAAKFLIRLFKLGPSHLKASETEDLTYSSLSFVRSCESTMPTGIW